MTSPASRIAIAAALLLAGTASAGRTAEPPRRLLGLRPPATPAAARFHVDCGAPGGGDGSRARPWNDLARASEVVLEPGSALLLKRGTACAGTLAPSGSGAAGRPAVIGAYGAGTAPRIDGTGEDALRLRDQSHVVVQDLEITNRGDFASRRRGVHVIAERGVVRGVTIRRLYIHDVEGDLAKDANGSGGIQVDVLGGLDPIARFEDLRIEQNRIEDVSRSGIFIVGTADPDRPRASEPWPAASTRVVVRGNRLARLGGDGIVPLGTLGALVEENTVSEGNLRGRGLTDPLGFVCSAGIWTFHANGTVIQRNHVHHMRFNGCDGTAYDVDYDQDGTVVQHNLSHDNEGGFILLCTDTEPRTAEVRYNLSLDDRFAIHTSPCSRLGGTFEGIRMRNNTFVAADPSVSLLGTRSSTLLDPDGLDFRSNLLVATEPQGEPFPCGPLCSHNLSFGLPAAGANAVAGDPRFVTGERRGRDRIAIGSGFRLLADSPAIGAGAEDLAPALTDYFGVAPPDDRPPTIGFDEAGAR